MVTVTPLRPPHEDSPAPAPGDGGDRQGVKLVTAVIPPERFEALFEALGEMGVPGMTVSEVGGMGRQRGHGGTYRGAEYRLELIPKLRVEVLGAGAEVKRLVDELVEAVRTGRIGDGKVWVRPVESVTRIRTGEIGVEAL